MDDAAPRRASLGYGDPRPRSGRDGGVLKSWGLPSSKGGFKTCVFVARHRYVPPLRWGGWGGLMKRRLWTSSEFIPISVRSFSPPCEGGVRGGGPGGTMAWYAGPEPLGLAELPAWPSTFAMPCPPPLTPS